MKKPGALRPQTSHLLAFLVMAGSGVLAGAALADGLPPVLPTSAGLTTPVPPTVSVTTPVATATVPIPTVSTPAVTTPTATTPTATTPSVTTPIVTTRSAATPSLTTPAVTTPAVTTPAHLAPAPVVKRVVHAVTTASTPIVQAAATRKPGVKLAVPLPQVTTSPTVALPSSAPAPALIPVHVASAGSTVPVDVGGGELLPRPQPDALGASPLRANDLVAGAIERTPAGTVLQSRLVARTAGTVLQSPLVAPLVAGAAGSPATSTPSPQPRRSPTPGGAGWSSVRSNPVEVAGGLALLVALLGLGAAGAARSSPGFVATCAELGRFPFPRFRILPCDSLAGGPITDARSFVADGSDGSGNAAAAAVQVKGRRVASRIAHVLGAKAFGPGAPAERAWELLKTIILTTLVAANGLLLTIRWQLGRWQSR